MEEVGETAMEMVAVLDSCSLPSDLMRDFCAAREGVNDSYHRFYPGKDDTKWDDRYRPGLSFLIRDALMKAGMIIDQDNEYFHVLIHMNW